MQPRNFVKDALLGVAIGDALGVPAEFVSRDERIDDPITCMRGYMTHNQPPGTWSDDTSLTLCLAEMLCKPYSLKALAGYFINWKEHGYCTAHGQVFDIGLATSVAIQRLATGTEPTEAGGKDEFSNGNGALMRILPLVFYIKDKPIDERFACTKDIAALTHGHIRSTIACFIYLEYARLIIAGNDKLIAYEQMRSIVVPYLSQNDLCPEAEINRFHKVLEIQVDNYDLARLKDQPLHQIDATGYVVSTLEASLWCLLHTDTYAEAVLKAVNLGDDTDTTAAVTGGLAGLLYGTNSIPTEWLEILARREDIENLAGRMNLALNM